jgi:PleD family two-component response regulator
MARMLIDQGHARSREHRPPDTWRNLLDRAEAALARAKRAGRDRREVA